MAVGEADFGQPPGQPTTPDKSMVDRPIERESPRVETLQSAGRPVDQHSTETRDSSVGRPPCRPTKT